MDSSATHVAGKAGPTPLRAPARTAEERPSVARPASVTGLAGHVGNRAIGSLLQRRRQRADVLPGPATTVAPVNDPLERDAHNEADRIAGPQAHEIVGAHPVSAAGVPTGLGAGQPLDNAIRRRFESELGAELGDVRVHTDHLAAQAASQLSASAYAVGNHIVFGHGNFATSTPRGSWLLAHELTHVLQHADGEQALVVHRAPEDVPALDRKLYDGVQAGGDDGYVRAAEALNAFSETDIRLRLSANPGGGRRVLSRGEIASIHLAALHTDGLGPGSNAAMLTRSAYLELNSDNELKRENWSGAAEYMNGFNDTDMKTRLRMMKVLQLKSLEVGALQNPKVGAHSALVKNIEEAIKIAQQAAIQQTVTEGERSGDLTLPTSNVGSGKPGSITSITLSGGSGNPDIGVAAADRESLPSDDDGMAMANADYVDNDVVHAWYDVLSNRFTIDYGSHKSIDFDFDGVLKGAHAGSPAVVTGYFRNKQNGRIYPTNFNKRQLPIISACALELERKAPAARAAVIGAMIDVAVAAHGVGTATMRANQAIAGSSGAGKKGGKPTDKEPEPKGKPGGSSEGTAAGSETTGKPGGGSKGTAAVDEPVAGGGTGRGSSAAADDGLSAAPSGKASARGGSSSRGRGGGGLEEVTPGTASGPPVQGIPNEINWSAIKGPLKAEGFLMRAAYGEVKVAGKLLGEGALVAAAPTARIVGQTVQVAEGAIAVGGWQTARAILVTGGKFVPTGVANVGRTVLYALVLKDTTYLIVSADKNDQPAHAPGVDTTEGKAPGKDSTPAKAPGTSTDSVPVNDPGDVQPAEAPGPLVDEPAECKKLIGSKTTHDHHVFPQKFRELFKQMDINIDQWTITMRWDKHVGKDGLHANFGWNDEWAEFFDKMPEVSKMTRQEALGWQLRAKNFGFRLMIEAGIDRGRLHPYRK